MRRGFAKAGAADNFKACVRMAALAAFSGRPAVLDEAVSIYSSCSCDLSLILIILAPVVLVLIFVGSVWPPIPASWPEVRPRLTPFESECPQHLTAHLEAE